MKHPIHYTLFCFHLNSMLDRNFSIPINVVKEKIDDGSIFNWLQEKYGLDMDMSLHKDQELSEMLDLFQQLNNVVDSKRKMGVEKNGLSLLLAYSIEGIQQSFN